MQVFMAGTATTFVLFIIIMLIGSVIMDSNK
jgi:hypothetical protein